MNDDFDSRSRVRRLTSDELWASYFIGFLAFFLGMGLGANVWLSIFFLMVCALAMAILFQFRGRRS